MDRSAAEFSHGIKHKQQGLNRLSALRVKLEKEQTRAQNEHAKAQMLQQCHQDRARAQAEMEAVAQQKAAKRKARMDAHEAHRAELAAGGGAAAQIEKVRERNATSGQTVREQSMKADEILDQRKQYILQQNMEMAEYVRGSTRSGVENATKLAQEQRSELAEERKQQSKKNSEFALKVREEQKKVKAEKHKRVQDGREKTRIKGDRLAEENRRIGEETRAQIAQEEEMLMQRDQYIADMKKSMHDEVKSQSEYGKEQRLAITQQRLADSQRMKDAQAKKMAKLAEDKRALQGKRHEKTSKLKEDIAERSRKAREDLHESRRAMVEMEKANQAKYISSAMAQNEAFEQAIKDEEQHLMDQLAAVRR